MVEHSLFFLRRCLAAFTLACWLYNVIATWDVRVPLKVLALSG